MESSDVDPVMASNDAVIPSDGDVITPDDIMQVDLTKEDTTDKTMEEINNLLGERSSSLKSTTSASSISARMKNLKTSVMPTIGETTGAAAIDGTTAASASGTTGDTTKPGGTTGTPKRPRNNSGDANPPAKRNKGHEKIDDDRVIRVYTWMSSNQVEAEGIFRRISNVYFQDKIAMLSPEDAKLRRRIQTPVWDRNGKYIKIFPHNDANPSLIAEELDFYYKLSVVTQGDLGTKWNEIFVSLNKFAISSAKGPVEAYEYLRYNIEEINSIPRKNWKMLTFRNVGREEYVPDNEGYERATSLGGSYAIILLHWGEWCKINHEGGTLEFVDGTVRLQPVKNQKGARGNKPSGAPNSNTSRKAPVSGANALSQTIRTFKPPQMTSAEITKDIAAKLSSLRHKNSYQNSLVSQVQERLHKKIYDSAALRSWIEWTSNLDKNRPAEDALLAKIGKRVLKNGDTGTVYSLGTVTVVSDTDNVDIEDGELSGLSKEERAKKVRNLKKARSKAKANLHKITLRDEAETKTLGDLIRSEQADLTSSEKETAKQLKDDLEKAATQVHNRATTLTRRRETLFQGDRYNSLS
jgi:hypothetical protein